MDDLKKISLKKIGIDKLVLIAIAGVVLIVTSVGDFYGETESETTSVSTQNYDETVVVEDEGELAELISYINGVGKVKVMITYKSTGEKVVKEDKTTESEQTSEVESDGSSRTVTGSSSSYTTVYMTDDDGNDVPYVVKTMLPEVEGVAVVAEGGGNAGVKEEIIGIVQALFDIESHKIWVTEMN